MPDTINLLPDSLANQIAAGEVIQRPASAVKELLENAVDAGAAEIRLVVHDAGKALIQVTDNGSGMSEIDARMCFERHATSKISQVDDLFHIRTMGFRGEALASIAAVAQVELRTKREQDESGTYIEIENSQVIKQEPVATTTGTCIAMKNLFFSVPARRNFLKSNAAEMRHIIDEFLRVALAFPQLFFSFTSNNQQVFHLERGTLKQRVVQILGNQYTSKLVTVHENTDYLNIHGFVGKPDTAKKTRGDQYLFVNNRFIKSAYLNHAVMSAYQQLIPSDSFPLYVLFIDLDPQQVDVNVHPTKQEIKFEDEKIVYAFVQAAVKHALAQHSITPTLDFDLDAGIQQLEAVSKPFTEQDKAAAASSPLYSSFSKANQAHFIETDKSELRHWKEFYEPASQPTNSPTQQREQPAPAFNSLLSATYQSQPLQLDETADLVQLLNTYILVPSPAGYLLLHQQAAHERILYERYASAVQSQGMAVQNSLFPLTLRLSAQDAALFNELITDLNLLGYSIEPFGNNDFVIQGTPADLDQGNEKQVIESMLEQYKHFSPDLKFSKREKLVRSLAGQHALKAGKRLTQREMHLLVQELFQCDTPNATITGNPTYLEFKKDQLDKMFGR
ncbi:MAG: DNA mismatch repair endonuclease MutL [Williamsia sp.]|nr:DNA mismatch repair endonuclease MutL [Williamsia sp.]